MRDPARSFEQPIQELTANLLRVITGAGKPQLIAAQASLVAKALSEGGDIGASAIARVVSDFPKPVYDLASRREYGDAEADWRRARWLVMHGVLQVLAAEMLGQQTQAKIGNKRLAAGLRAFEDLRDRQRELLHGEDDIAELLPPLKDAKRPPRPRARSRNGSSRPDAGEDMTAD